MSAPLVDVDPIADVLHGHWTTGTFHDLYDDTYCVLGAAGQAWHDDSEWFADEFFYRLSPEEVAWLDSFADYLLTTVDVLSEPEEVGTRSLVEMYRSGEANAARVITYWNDHVARSEDEIMAVLRAHAGVLA